ncbi:TetR/AcrR family transcriptional regulator [Paenibacillus donghaensis]|uniref:TetR family transcriptional regulator n=1 Tax=Paenibacillus donghaensis TaxID=414771 RepID=A0A2Z2KJH5_9BACL|nr:TetR/AcrR family transcriptional regulator C-terminal domain-containing protein [Paenibacillus donghaensis]ASA23440.1 TetR family transcriptional regulator [Paenibacillus donghaensis]
MNKIDRRILKSHTAIQSAFLTMLIEVGFDAISVKAITDRADISRKTFYLHYVDKYDLLDRIVAKQLEELEEICDQKKEKGFVEGTVIWFHYFEKHKAFFSALFISRSTVTFRERLLNFMMNQLSNKIDKRDSKNDNEILLKFLGMAVLGIMESFVLNHLNGSTEQIATQVGELMMRTI